MGSIILRHEKRMAEVVEQKSRVMLLTAMQRYGLMLADQGSAWYVTGTSDPRWADALDQLRRAPVRGRDFEVVASGPLTAC